MVVDEMTHKEDLELTTYEYKESPMGYHESVGSTLGADEWDILEQLGLKGNVKLYKKRVGVMDISTTVFKKKSRQQTVIGLTGLVGEWGVVTPIHVMAMEDEGVYMLLDGLRRLFGAIRNSLDEVDVIVWDFDDKDEGKEFANVISLMLHRSQRYSPSEVWDMMRDLETVNDLTPGMIEYLLQLNPGDAMKYKDVMMADAEYFDIKEELMENVSSIDAAYKKLTARRKKENRLAKEDSLVLEGSGDQEQAGSELDDKQRLSVENVKELLEMTEVDVDGDIRLEDMDRTEEVRGDIVQDVKDRKPIDPAIKQSTFIRDGFKCRCCDKGGSQWLGVLVYHHVIPVFLHGEDSVENGLTICSDCHITLHLYSFGKVHVNFEELDDREKKIFRNIFKYGNIIIEAMKRVGMTKEVGYKEDAGSRRHLYPGEGLRDNKEAYKVYQEQIGVSAG